MGADQFGRTVAAMGFAMGGIALSVFGFHRARGQSACNSRTDAFDAIIHEPIPEPYIAAQAPVRR